MANIRDNSKLTLECRGVCLTPLSFDEIELVRHWRNSPEIQRTMIVRNNISAEAQISWFQGLRPQSDYYFMIHANRTKIGVANLKDIDRAAMSGEVGIFIGRNEYQQGWYGVLAMLMLTDFAFSDLELATLKSRVVEENSLALKFNKFFGYETKAVHNGVIYLELTSERWKHARERVAKPFAALKSNGNKGES